MQSSFQHQNVFPPQAGLWRSRFRVPEKGNFLGLRAEVKPRRLSSQSILLVFYMSICETACQARLHTDNRLFIRFFIRFLAELEY